MISVLYIDDEPDLLEVGKLFLEREGQFSVATVTSAKKALEALRASSFDAIISDYQMPGMTGIDLLRKVRESGNAIPFIIFTGRGREEIVIQALNEGADFYLQKGGEPISQFAELAHKIKKAVLQKRAEVSIRDHERRETDIINFLPDATFAVDTRGVVIAWNRAMEKMTGVAAGDIVGKGDFEYALPFYRKRRPILIDLVLNDDPAITAKYPYVNREGEKLFSETTIPHLNDGRGAALWFTASPLYNTKGEVVGAIESIREITERKQAEEALRFANALLSTQLESSPDGILVVGEKGTMLSFNRRFIEMWGIPEDVILSRSSDRALQSVLEKLANPDEFLARVRYLYAHKNEMSREEIALRDGRTFERYSAPMFGPDGKYYGRVWNFRDLIERRLAEEALKQSEIRFRSLIQNASDMTRILDREGRIMYESPSSATILGYPPGENLGKDPMIFVHPDDLERVRADLRDVYDRKNPGTPTEFRVKRADGTYLWVDTVATNMLDVPAVNGIVVTTRPIEQRKRLENEIRESEEKYRLVVENSEDAIYIHREDRLLFVNARSVEVTGYGKDELLGMNLWDLVHPDDRGRLQESARRRFAGEDVPSCFSARLVTKAGETREGEFFVDRVIYLGTPAVLGIFRDSTEQNRAVRSILESEDKYRTIFENTGTATIQVEEDHVISHVNMMFEQQTGYRRDEIEGKRKWTEFVHPDDLKKMEEYHRIRRDSGGGAPVQYEFRLIAKDGTKKDILLSVGLIPGTKKSIASLVDLTELKKAQAGLIAADKEYRNLLSQIQDIYYRSDPEGRLIRASASWAKLLGYDDSSECIGRNIATDFYVNPPDRIAFLEQIYQNGKVTNYEVLLKRKDGTSVLVATNSHLSYDADGNVIGVEGTFRDITERKQQEEILRIQLELGLQLQTAHSLEDALKACLSAAVRISGMDAGGVYLSDAGGSAFDLVVSQNLTDEFLADSARYARGSRQAQIAREGRPVYLPFDAISPDHSAAQMQEGLQAIAILPIVFGGKTIACLNVSSHTRGEIPDKARAALETIAPQIAAAVVRIRADEALKESEQRYRNVVEDQTEFISRFLPDGTHIFVNDAYCRYFGFARDHIIGHRFRPKIPAEDRSRVSRFFKSLTPVHPVDIIEHRIIMPDGTVRWQRWSDRAIFDASGTIVEYQSVGRDVTVIKNAEEDLSESRERFRRIFEDSPLGIAIVSPDFRFRMVNRQFCAMLQYGENDLLEKTFMDITHPDHVGTDLAGSRKIYTGEHETYKTEKRYIKKDGSVLWASVTASPVKDENGNVMYTIALIEDITGQRRVKEALNESEEMYRNLSEASLDMIFVIDRSYRVTYVNTSAADMLGMPAREIKGRKYRELFPPEISGSQEEAIRTVFETAGPLHSTGKITFSAQTLWFDHSLIPVFDTEGNVSHVLGISRDITDLKVTEEALRQRTEELDYREQVIREANRKINLLTSITRHDVANQVSILKGFAQVAMMMKPAPVITDLLAKIDAAGSAIARQVEFTRAYQDLGVKAPAWYSISEVVAQQKRDDIHVVCSCKAEVFADPMLEKVFFNLIDNALRHGGHATEVSVSCRTDPGRLVIEVEDNGDGVPDGLKETIFEKGFGKNTGFGLFLAREILAITGITIRENGTPGTGARFEIAVPEGTYRIP